MACSKLFSGDLPELISEIIYYFHHDYKTLHSCILVNRLWCRLAIPLLKLNEYGIIYDLFSSNTLFNYPRFIKCLNIDKISFSVEKWMATRTLITGKNLAIQSIFKSLFKTFIENENNVNLHTFEVEIKTNPCNSNFNTTYELILQNPNFLHNIRKFKILYYHSIMEIFEANFDSFLNLLYSNCKLISSFHFEFKHLSSSYYSFLSLKSHNHSNTLRIIVFCRVSFINMIDLGEAIEQLNVLESIHILYCSTLYYFIKQIINITKPFKLKSLFMNNNSLEINSLKLLLEKSGNYLENFVLNSVTYNEEKSQLLELLIKYCANISFLDLMGLDHQNIFLVFGLIENIEQNLNYLSIDILNYSNHHLCDDALLSSIVLLNLGQILPHKLEYLNLSLKINPIDLKVFLESSQNTFIRKLLINDADQKESKEILPYIKEYIMKKKRVRYLAILGNLSGEEKNLITSIDEIKEFELYDIKVQHYDNLFIQICNYINFLKQY
ncbi:hypothetical protein GLOIN_2v1779695 [Rhizophagus irregularis DAOM 181602=DAOM 197198]|uniref:F-box domain-containing protein n=3 Tax=Rhizophagus irregularis TaxID=588596 RepID=A0A2P4PP48_RHIID|nr:hypothetical protein GLOIN_2v1779695 [Rhizophagus irregularis DAOM 181602=DAOM 197198]POG67151.1 hypothetical protein GLOIN_2v1779695 [Rhizophagus irregularis DAOM 181602=DAOM 197198]|eukprot:XP_025174017.1 hypothetical protein GLOIN_2v1779695 [Rhizophagus irregularis DAOM 181602=DAOM 197198]